MAEIVARVGKLTGQAIARDLDGNVRALKSGDPIREGEVVQSADGSQVQLTLTDGGQVTLNANEAAKLDAEVASPDLPDAGDSSVQNVTQIFTRVSKTVVGQDGTFSFDDDGGKGAGSAVQNEGHSFVELLRIVESVDPLAFEYGTGRGQPLEEIRGGGIWNNAATVFTFAPPETENISVAGSEDSPIRIDLKGSDPDGLVAGYAIRSLPANGLLYADAALTQLVSVGQTVAGPVYFKPNDNWNGTASFEYATVDNTGSVDETPATVTIDIAPVNDFVSLAIPDVNGGNTGQSNVVENATTTGSFTISAPDGLDPTAALTIAGTAVSKAALEGSSATPVEIATPEGKLTITGYNPVTGVVSYSYDPSGTAKDHTGGEVVNAINIVVRDNNGDTQSGTLSINILDTVPVANPDTATITEDAASDTVGGNVIVTGGGQDTLGADATSVTGVVAGIGTPGNNVAEGSTSSAGATVVTGLYGSLMLGADGSYSYRLDNTNAAVNALKDTETLSETFTYTITDADGDTSSTTLTLTINGTTDGAPSIVPVNGNGSSVTGQVSVYEAGLTSVGDTSETTTGTINVGTPDGLTSVKIGGVTLTVAELQALSAGSPQTIDTGEGTLTLTGFSGTGTAPLSGVISYTYTLKAALTHTGATASESSDLIALEVTDRGGITTNGTLTVQIVNDTPTAKADSNSVTEDANPNAVSGNVMTAGVGQDDLSADNTQVTGVVPGTGVPGTNVATGTSSVNGTTVAGQYGELKIGADGSYVYTLDNALPATQALNQGQQVLETFTYTITDADGDASNTTITVTINGTNDVPVVTNLPAATAGSVSEAGHLDDGTVVAGTATATGDLNASDVDSGATQTWGLQGTPSTTYGSMAIDSSTGVWTYTLDNNLAATQALKEGEVVTQTYTARVTDDKGAYVDQTITVTINGTNDVPVVTNLPAATAGSVSEAGHLDDGTVVAGTVTATGDLNASDVDSGATQTWGLQGTPSTTYGSMAIDSSTGVWTYTLDNNLAATQALKEGEVVTQTYTARVTDDKGAYVDQTITVTINGTNDVPVVTNLPAATAGSVSEAGHLDDGTVVAGTVTATGDLNASDVDSGATQTWGLQGTPSTTYGSMAIDSSTGVWTYTLDNNLAATQALKEGEVVTQTYTARVTDDKGAYVDQTITVTINGTNDVPVVTNLPAATAGSVSEAGHLDDGTVVAGTVTATGDLNASDVDSGATQTWGLQGTPSTTYGSMAIDSSTGVWTYTLDNNLAATQALKEGEVVTQTYTARVTDDKGAYVDQTITVTINGTNDVPVVTNLPAATAGSVSEAGHLDDGTVVAGTVTATGDLNASDVDSGATQTWGLQGTPSTTYGSMAIDSSTGVWTYTLDNNLAATQALKEGEVVTQTYTARVTDDKGAYVDQTITVTINGTNDVPVVTNLPAATAGSVSEAGHLDDGTVVAGTVTATGDLNASDVDSGATQTWSLQGTPSTTYGSMAIDSSTGVWTYALDNNLAATQALKEGEVVTQTYVARVTDDFGAWVDQTITVTINGTNDVPVAVADTRTVTEDAADQTGNDDGNPATTIVSGNVLTNDTDVDSGDKATLAVIGVAAGSLASASGNVATSVAGTYGSVSIAADGTYTYTLDNSKPTVQALARGQLVTDTFTYTIADSQGATSSTALTVTVNGANDAPVITVRADDADSASLTETNSGLIVSDTLSVFDVDTQDTVAVSKVDSLVVGGTYSGARPTDTVLKGMFSVSGGEGSAVAQDAPNGITWIFNSGSEAFNSIPAGQTLILTYTVRATDSQGASVDQPVTITITGTNDGVVAVNDTLTIAENATGAALGGNVLSNDTLDPDAGATTTVSSFSLDADGNGSQDVFTPGTPVTVTTSAGTLGVLTLASNGAYTFTPHQANYSGPVPVITYTLSSSTGETATATLTLNVTPVSDAPGVTRDAATVTTNEDTAVALGFNAPTVTDAVDQNGIGGSGDNPERLSLITLSGIPSGAKLLDGTNSDATLFTSTGGNITIRLSDVSNLIASPGAATLTMTTAQFEALKFLPLADSGVNIARIRMGVTEYEVTDVGNPISGVGGATRNADVAVDVRAVTDTVDLKINGTDGPYDVTIQEDSALDFKELLLSAAFQDLDGSEVRFIDLAGLPVGSVVNGVVIGAAGTASIQLVGNNTLPAISLIPPANFSGDINNITVTLRAKDTDADSTVTTLTQTDSVTLNLHVNPVAGDVTVGNVATPEDTAVKFLQGVALTDTDGSEVLNGIVVKGVPIGWVLKDDAGTVVFTGNGVATYTLPAGEVSNGDFRNYTLTPPAHSSANATISLDLTTTDSQTVNGSLVTNTQTVTRNETITVTAVAEIVGGDSNGDAVSDLTMTPGFVYTSQGAEDQWFNLNSDGFNLKTNWTNQDADGSEQTFALLTPVLSGGSAIGSQFRYTDGSGVHVLTYNGTAIEIPMAYLNTVEFMAAANVAGAFTIGVEAKTVDTDPDTGVSVSAVSGSATLTNLFIAPVADAVTLAVTGSVTGNEDSLIPLRIKPTSADSSETFNVTISNIPAGSTLVYNGTQVTISGDSATIANFDSTKSLAIQPPANSNTDFSLNVSAVSVDTVGGVTSTSSPTMLSIAVNVRGVADLPTITTAPLPFVTTEAAVDAGAKRIALSGIVTGAALTDSDGSETLSFVLSGLPVGFTVEGLTFTGGSGAARIWAGTAAEFASAKIVVLDDNYSGSFDFTFRAITTENDGNSLTGNWNSVSVQVTPSPEATINTTTVANEDALTRVDFSLQIQHGDSNESLSSVWINAADLAGKPFTLYLGATPITSLVADDGWYKLSGSDIGNVFVKGAANSDADGTFGIRYAITDPSNDGTLPPVTQQFDTNYSIQVNPVTDATTSSNDFVSRVIVTTEVVTVNVTVTQNDDPNAGNTKDIDGSEKLLYFIVNNVPVGVTVVGGSYIGNTPGNPNTGRWILDVADTAFSSASLTQAVQFSLDGTATQLSGLTQTISITAYTQDSGAIVAMSATNWTLETSAAFIDTSPSPTTPAATIATWANDPAAPTMTEDTPVTLNTLLDASVTGSSPFAVTLTGLPAGTVVTGMMMTMVGGTEVWSAQGSGDNSALQALLNSITVTAPVNANSNGGPFDFSVTLTTYDDGGGRHDASLTASLPVTPVSDPIVLAAIDSDVGEDSTAMISITLTNAADGVNTNVVDGKVYLRLDESGMEATGGVLSFNGNPVSPTTVSGVSGIADGTYFVLAGVANDTTLNLSYQPVANASGTVGYTAYVLNQETGAANVVTSSTSGTFDILKINDGVTLNASNATGVEDQAVQLAISATLRDSGEQIQSVTLAQVPDGFQVIYGSDALHSAVAINMGGGVWSVSASSGSVPAYIALVPPPNWSGTVSGVTAEVWSGEAGLDQTANSASFDVTINGVADGILISPTLSFGNEGQVVSLNLNSAMPDMDGSETAIITVNGLGGFAAFYAAGSLLTASYDSGSDTYTLSGLTPAQVSGLGVIQKDGSYDLTITAQTADSPGGDLSAVVSASAHLDISPVAATTGDDRLLYDGSALNGLAGVDTIEFRLGENLDFSTSFVRPTNIERFDLMPAGQDHSLGHLSVQDVLDMTGSGKSLTILGDSGDSVSLKSTVGGTWSVGGMETAGGHNFDVYLNTQDPAIKVLIEQQIVKSIDP